MIAWLRPSRWPLALKVPLLLATLVVVVAVGISKAVLDRLEQSQQRHFQELTSLFLQGLSTALQPYVIRRDPWEVFDVLDRARERYSTLNARMTLVVGPDGKVLAASDPAQFPIGSIPPEELPSLPDLPNLDDPRGEIWIKRELREAGADLGMVAALVDVSHIQTARRDTLVALVGFNALLTILLGAVGWMLARRAMLPLIRLSGLLARSTEGRLPLVPAGELPPPDTEAGQAYRHYNAAAAAVGEREALLKRLASEERVSLIGRYASALAHEVNNPLGGLFNAVRMIQRHGDDPIQRDKAAQLLERGLTGIRNVVKASLVLWRTPADAAMVTPSDVEDLRYLVASEAERRKLALDWDNRVELSVSVPVQPVRQIALNLLLNAFAASPLGAKVCFRAFDDGDALHLHIEDEGPGLPEESSKVLLTSAELGIPTSSGLGLWTVARLVAELKGQISLSTSNGTLIAVRLPHHAGHSLKSAA